MLKRPEVVDRVSVDYDDICRETLSQSPAILGNVEPVYKNLRGWQTSSVGIQEWSALPAAAQDYLKFASDYLGVPISMVSTGPARHETIHI